MVLENGIGGGCSTETGGGSGNEAELGGPKRKKPYKELNLDEKVQLIHLAEGNPGLSQASIADFYQIAKSNVCRILQRRQEYLAAYQSAHYDGNRKRKLRTDGLPAPSAIQSTADQNGDGDGDLRVQNPYNTESRLNCSLTCRWCNSSFADRHSLKLHVEESCKESTIVGETAAAATDDSSSGAADNSSSAAEQQPTVASAAAKLLFASSTPPSAANLASLFSSPLFSSAQQILLQNQRIFNPNLSSWMANLAKLGQVTNVVVDPNSNGVGSADVQTSLEVKVSDGDGSPSDAVCSGASKVDDDCLNSPVEGRLCVVDVDDEGQEKAEKPPSDSYSSLSPTIVAKSAETSIPALSENRASGQTTEMPLLRSAINGDSCGMAALNNLLFKKMDEHFRQSYVSALMADSASLPTSPASKTATRGDVHDKEASSSTRSPPSLTPSNSQSQGQRSCFECQLHHDKLAVVGRRGQLLQGKVNVLQVKLDQLEHQLGDSERLVDRQETESKKYRLRNETLQQKLLRCQELCLLYLQNFGGSDAPSSRALQQFLGEVVRSTLLYV